MTAPSSRTLRAGLLVTPLLIFIVVFFLSPLGVMMKQAVSDTAVLHVLPQTAEAISQWDGQSGLTPAMKEALVADLKGSSDQQAIGDMVRRLNSPRRVSEP